MNELQLRKVEEKDCRQLFDWRNDPDVRRNSFHSEPVFWEDHVRWFHRMLSDPEQRQYILVKKAGEKGSGGIPAGQIRIRRMTQPYLSGDGKDGDATGTDHVNATGTAACGISAMDTGTIGTRKPTASPWEISYSISADFRGQGLGTKMVLLLEAAIRNERLPVSVLIALVKPENLPSRKVFEHAGYQQMPVEETGGAKVTYIEFQKTTG